MIKFVYKLFIGVLLAATIGMGLAAFYPNPKYPQHPYSYVNPGVAEKPSAEFEKQQKEYEREFREFEVKRQTHDRNTALVVISLSLVVLVLSSTVLRKIDVVNEGLLLGGVFTLLYGLIRSFGSGDQKLIFVAMLIGLITSVILSYQLFIRPDKKAKTKKRK